MASASAHDGWDDENDGPLSSQLRQLRDWGKCVIAALRPRKTLRITIRDQALSFPSVTDFEFALASRTEFPAASIDKLIALSPEKLKRAAISIRDVERRLLQLFTESMDKPGGVGAALGSVDLKLFSQDHGWRDIIEALDNTEPDVDEYKRIAFTKYLQYLGSRQSVLQSIYMQKQGREPATVIVDQDVTRIHNETAIFDSLQTNSEHDRSARLRQIPRGETVGIKLGDSDEIDIMLSRHKFRLIGGARFRLRDESGADYMLGPGKNIVGRQAGNDVVIDGTYRAVSRRHMIVEPLGERTLLLTDLSSHGTFVPPQCVA